MKKKKKRLRKSVRIKDMFYEGENVKVIKLIK